MNFRVVIPARANSKRLPGKNTKILGDKPLIQYSIEFALDNFPKDYIWVNSDDKNILNLSNKFGVNSLLRPAKLSQDNTPTVDVLKHQIAFFSKNNINCDSIILLQPTNPFRNKDLIKLALEKFNSHKRNSLVTFSQTRKKMGNINEENFYPINYLPGQRSQEISNTYFENGQLYITKVESILNGNIITDDVYPFICDDFGSTIDIDTEDDFNIAELYLKNNYEK